MGVPEQNIFYFGALVNCGTPPGSARDAHRFCLRPAKLEAPTGHEKGSKWSTEERWAAGVGWW